MNATKQPARRGVLALLAGAAAAPTAAASPTVASITAAELELIAAAESDHEDGVTPINPAWICQQAGQWAETLAASSKPNVCIGEVYIWGGAEHAAGKFTSEMFESLPLDMPRELAIEMLRWLERRALDEMRTEGGAA